MIMMLIGFVALAIFGLLGAYGIYLLSEMFASQSDKALYTASATGGQQIEGAIRAYSAEIGGLPPATSPTSVVETLLATGYLRNLRPGVNYIEGATPATVWAISGNRAYTPLQDVNQCLRMNRVAGKPIDGPGAPSGGCPQCSDETFTDYPACIGTLE